MPQEVYADGECTPSKQLKDSFNEARAVEKSGNLALAFAAYEFAQYGHSCEGPNPHSKDGQEGWKRTGQRLAKDAEAKGNFYSNGIYTEVTGPSGLRWVVWKDVGAFYWYSKIGESDQADRVMFQYVQSKPKDLGTITMGVSHFFQGDNGGVKNFEILREMEKEAKSNPGDKALQTRVGRLKELEKIALKNIDEELAQEEQAYNTKQTAFEAAFSQKNKPASESQKHVTAARYWYDLFSDLKGNKPVERAEKRGDASTKIETPQSLANAAWYYGFAEDAERVRKVIEQANRLGDVHAKKGEYATAVEYYEIGHSETGENEDKINKLQSLLEKETEKKEQAKQKALQDMTKDEKKQKEFKKGQENLEKELGF
jgi:hypothetical protein